MSINLKNGIAGVVALGIIGSGVAFAPAAFASHGGGGVKASGSCSAGATWKLKAKVDDGALEVEAEVDSNVVGQTWTWKITDNGKKAAKGTSVTTDPSGSFSVNRVITNQTGTDAIAFRAVNAGQVCSGSVSV